MNNDYNKKGGGSKPRKPKDKPQVSTAPEPPPLNVEEISAYMTSDDKLFRDRSDAEKHENFIAARRRYHDSPLSSNARGDLGFDDVVTWARHNPEIVKLLVALL